MAQKGQSLEELVRAYYAKQGFFALRGVSLRFEDEEVTDLDVWLYGRQTSSVRTRTIVDVKDKRSPKAFERILWARGVQLALGCDRAVVATTDNSLKVQRFAQQSKVALLNKSFLDRLEKSLENNSRLTSEEFNANILQYRDAKNDGDWLGRLAGAKSGLVSLSGYPAFNRAMGAFRFFAERAETRQAFKEQALRCVYLSAALACIALDTALEGSQYDDLPSRQNRIAAGVTYGDSGEGRVQTSIRSVLSVIATGMENGRVVARQAQEAMDALFGAIRSEIISEFFSREHNSAALYSVAIELDEHAFISERNEIQNLSVSAKSIVGVFCDFVQIRRNNILNGGLPPIPFPIREEGSLRDKDASGVAKRDVDPHLL